ncbi:MAG: hypothetical protein GXC75_04215 [Xanthomonadaceae bacterium]|nr:hypothetical protein [Xanthomonadaceae bacterium]
MFEVRSFVLRAPLFLALLFGSQASFAQSVATISVSPTSVAEDSGTPLMYTVVLDQPSAGDLTVNYAVLGDATSGSDYPTPSGSVVILAGSTSGTISITPTADTTVEGDELVNLTLENGAGYTLGLPQSATATITNDDVPALSINDISVTEGNSGFAFATFTVTLDQPAGPGGVSFTYSSADGTATAGSDYGAASGLTGTIAAGSSSSTIFLLVNGDTTPESDETFTVTLSGVTGATLTKAAGTATILDDDTPAPTVSISGSTITEGNSGSSDLAFTVSLSAASTQTVTVAYVAADGTATTANNDYTATSGTLTFAPGETSKTVNVLVIGDTAFEADETFTLGLSAPTNATLGTAAATGTIVNDDAAPVLTIGDVVYAEGNVGTYQAALNVSLDKPAGPGGVSFDFATADGTATAGSDYNANSGSVTIPAGQTSATVSATVLSDTTFEPDEAFTFNISNVVGATVSKGTGTVQISNDDAAPPSSISVANASIVEGNSGTSTLTFTLTLSAASAMPIDVNYATEDGTASVGSDYADTGGSLTFAPGETSKTIDVPVIGDTLFELDEAFLLKIFYLEGSVFTTKQATGTIVNDDLPVPPPTVSVSGATITEGNSGSSNLAFTVSLDAASAQPILVLYGTFDGSATTADNDYTVTSGTLAFAPGETSKTVNVSVIGDTAIEPDETFTLGLGGATNATVGTAAATGTIVNDDAAPTITVSPGTLPAGTVGSAYSQAITASGGTGPYIFAVTTGALPAGLTLASNGTLSGTPTAGGSFNFTVSATDANGFTGSQAYALTVNGPTITVSPGTLPAGTVGSAYSQARERPDDHRQPGDVAGGHCRLSLLAGHHCQWRHRPLHLCGDHRRLASRADPGQQRYPQWYADGRRQL